MAGSDFRQLSLSSSQTVTLTDHVDAWRYPDRMRGFRAFVR
jgi:hypothetical protein